MILRETELPGAYEIALEERRDDRGFFARTWCEREFADHGLDPRLVQMSLSYSRHAGTLRGLHYQSAPHEETKVVRCTRGAMYDVLVDLRPASPAYAGWIARELTADNRLMLYVPKGVAHGFLTLADDTEVAYQMSEFHAPGFERGVRYDDPAFAIRWPAEVRVISSRDAGWPAFRP